MNRLQKDKLNLHIIHLKKPFHYRINTNHIVQDQQNKER